MTSGDGAHGERGAPEERVAGGEGHRVQALYEREMRQEFAETQIITAWGHDAGVIHTRREVRLAVRASL